MLTISKRYRDGECRIRFHFLFRGILLSTVNSQNHRILYLDKDSFPSRLINLQQLIAHNPKDHLYNDCAAPFVHADNKVPTAYKSSSARSRQEWVQVHFGINHHKARCRC